MLTSSTPKKLFGTFSWYTTFPQSFKSLSLLEQKLGRGDENIPPGLRSPKKPRPNRVKRKVFLVILQNSQESTCVRVSFLIKLQVGGLQLY